MAWEHEDQPIIEGLIKELTSIRKERGISQMALSIRAGKSTGVLNLIERTNRAKLDTIQTFFKALGIRIVVTLEPIEE